MMLKKMDRRLLTVLSIVFVQIAGAALILPVLPLFAQRQFNMSPEAVALLVSSYFMAQFFAGPFLGQLSDQYGRVPLLVYSQLGSAVSFFLMAAAGAPALLFVARAIDGITGGNIIIAQAYITDITPKEERTEALGYVFAAFGIGFIVGPALGGLLSAWLGPRMPFVIAGLASVATAIASWRLLNETVERSANKKAAAPQIRISPLDTLHNLRLMLILSMGFVSQFGLGMLQSTFALFAAAVLFRGASDETTNLGIGLLLAVVGFGQFSTQMWLIRPLRRRVGDSRLVLIGAASRTIGLVIYALAHTPLAIIPGAAFFSVGQGLMTPPLQSLATRTVDESVRGGVLGIYQSAVSLATIISTAIAGLVFSVRPTMPYWVAASLSFLLIFPGLALPRILKDIGARPPVDRPAA